MSPLMNYLDTRKIFLAAIGACFAGTVLCYVGKLSGGEWVAMLVGVFVPLLAKEGYADVKIAAINAQTPPA